MGVIYVISLTWQYFKGQHSGVVIMKMFPPKPLPTLQPSLLILSIPPSKDEFRTGRSLWNSRQGRRNDALKDLVWMGVPRLCFTASRFLVFLDKGAWGLPLYKTTFLQVATVSQVRLSDLGLVTYKTVSIWLLDLGLGIQVWGLSSSWPWETMLRRLRLFDQVLDGQVEVNPRLLLNIEGLAILANTLK